jgi:hypothetical protein
MIESNEESNAENDDLIGRREAILRVTAILGGIALIGGDALLRPRRLHAATHAATDFTAYEIAYLDEIADTILPTTPSSPGAKAAKTGALMALIVTDSYEERDQKIFRAGMKAIDDASMRAHGKVFMDLTPEQRLAVLTPIDQEAKVYSDALGEFHRNESLKWLNDQRQEATPEAPAANPAPAITGDSPPHYFRMMKELALLGFFTSEIGMTKAQRYIESPGRWDPCLPYKPGEKSWASHA